MFCWALLAGGARVEAAGQQQLLVGPALADAAVFEDDDLIAGPHTADRFDNLNDARECWARKATAWRLIGLVAGEVTW